MQTRHHHKGVVPSTAAVVVVNPIAVSCNILTPTTNLLVGDSITLTAQFIDQFGSLVTIGYAPFWVSLDPSVLAINSSTGVLTTVGGLGVATIQMDDVGHTIPPDLQQFQVSNPGGTVAAVVVGPTSAVVTVNQNGTLTTQVQDSNGLNMVGRTVTYASSNTGVVTVGADAVAGTIHTMVYHGVAAGSANITVTDQGSGMQTVIPVTVQTASAVQPVVDNDFSQYASIAACVADGGNGKTWSVASVYPNNGPGGEALGVSAMSLGTDGGVFGSPNYLRYNVPDRTGLGPGIKGGTVGYCHDGYIFLNLRLPLGTGGVLPIDVWFEFYVRFSANYETVCPGGVCAGPPIISNPAQKFILGRVNPGSYGSQRFDWEIGNGDGNKITIAFLGNGYDGGSGGGQTGGTNHTMYFDGNWHRWRGRYRVDPSCAHSVAVHDNVPGTGRCVAYFENTLLINQQNVGLGAANIYGLTLLRNLNQGPIGHSQTCDFGRLRAWYANPGWVEAGF